MNNIEYLKIINEILEKIKKLKDSFDYLEENIPERFKKDLIKLKNLVSKDIENKTKNILNILNKEISKTQNNFLEFLNQLKNQNFEEISSIKSRLNSFEYIKEDLVLIKNNFKKLNNKFSEILEELEEKANKEELEEKVDKEELENKIKEIEKELEKINNRLSYISKKAPLVASAGFYLLLENIEKGRYSKLNFLQGNNITISFSENKEDGRVNLIIDTNNSSLSNTFVPYTGAVQDVNLGNNKLIVDTNTLYVDNVNHRVGIGTTSPLYKLSVVGGNIYGSDNFYILGNVGIGTISPQFKLHIVDGHIQIERTSAIDTWLLFKPSGTLSSSNPRWHIGHLSTNQFTIRTWDGTSNIDRLTITPDGKVGIGITNPAHKLTIENGYLQIALSGEGSNVFRGLILYPDITTGTNPHRIVGWGNNSGLRLTARNTSYGNDVSNILLHPQGYISFSIAPSPSSAAVEVARIINNGNFGIGTTAPNAKLDVRGNISFGSGGNQKLLQVAGEVAGEDLIIWNAQGSIHQRIKIVDGSDASNMGFAFERSTDSGSTWIRDVFIRGGNVGIGTTSPAAKLHIASGTSSMSSTNIPALQVSSTNYPVASILRETNITNDIRGTLTFIHKTTGNMADGFGASIDFEAWDATTTNYNPLGTISASRDGANNQGKLSFWTWSGGARIERLTIKSNGNVGIGTTSPTAKLHIQGTTGYNQLRLATSYTPTSSNDINGNVGDIAWDDNFVYVKTSAGWKRAALSTF